MEITDRLIGGLQLSVAISDQSNVGECRRAARALAEGHGFDEVALGRISIIATEIATNILRHAGTGTVLIQLLDDAVQPELEVLGVDRGPGMPDVDQCLRDGYSTGGTAGTGFGAIARLSTTFDVYSTPGEGTIVLSRTVSGSTARGDSVAAKPGLELGAICLAVAGEIECGDSWRVAERATLVSLMVTDGLGHGPLAAAASKAAVAAFITNPFEAPSSSMTSLHRSLSGTRGAAAACALLYPSDAKIHYAGVGNICGSVVTNGRQRGMVSHNGTLGMQLLRAQQFEYQWLSGSVVVMHSDGVSARWNLEDYPNLIHHHPAIIAGILYRDFSRERDDATVIVVRHR